MASSQEPSQGARSSSTSRKISSQSTQVLLKSACRPRKPKEGSPDHFVIAATLRRSSSGSDTSVVAMAAGSESTISRYKLDRLVQINGAEVPKIYGLCGLKTCATQSRQEVAAFPSLSFSSILQCQLSFVRFHFQRRSIFRPSFPHIPRHPSPQLVWSRRPLPFLSL